FWPSAPCNRPPLFIMSRHAASGHARQRLAAVLACESESAKAAILRSRCEFHGTRYHEAAGFTTDKSGFSPKFRRDGEMKLLLAALVAAHGGPRVSSSDSPRHPPRRADPFARGGRESHSPPGRRSTRPQDRGAAASHQGRYDTGSGRRRRRGVSRLGRGGRPAAGPARKTARALNEVRRSSSCGFARPKRRSLAGKAYFLKFTCARESRRSP